LVSSWEGCFSVEYGEGKNHIAVGAKIERPRAIMVEYQDRNGAKISRTLDGFGARIVLHEYDHFFGITFPMRVKDEAVLYQVSQVGDNNKKVGELSRTGKLDQWKNTINKTELAKHLQLPIEKLKYQGYEVDKIIKV